MMNFPEPAKVLTIAGSDSGGAAGLQADLRAFAALGVYGLSVVTAVTAQNSLTVSAVQFMPPAFIAAQLEAVLADYGAAAAKTGFLGRAEAIRAVARTLQQHPVAHLVVDPVLVNHKGQAMFSPDVTQAYLDELLPLAALVTPNRWEAALLAGLPVTTVAEMETAVSHIHALGSQNVLLKGGQVQDQMLDIFFDGHTLTHLTSPTIDTANTHGAGDTLSAAVCAFLAQGAGMETAVLRARHVTYQAILRAAGWQLGQGHGPVWPLDTPPQSRY